MVQDQDLGVLARDALVPGHYLRPAGHLDGGGGQPHRQPPADIAGRDGVVVLPYVHPGPAIHPGLPQPRRVELLSRERQHGELLFGERRGDRDRPDR